MSVHAVCAEVTGQRNAEIARLNAELAALKAALRGLKGAAEKLSLKAARASLGQPVGVRGIHCVPEIYDALGRADIALGITLETPGRIAGAKRYLVEWSCEREWAVKGWCGKDDLYVVLASDYDALAAQAGAKG